MGIEIVNLNLCQEQVSEEIEKPNWAIKWQRKDNRHITWKPPHVNGVFERTTDANSERDHFRDVDQLDKQNWK